MINLHKTGLAMVMTLTLACCTTSYAALTNAITDNSMQQLKEAVKNAGYRHLLYTTNLANAMTPGYRPSRLPEELEVVNAKRKLGIEDSVVIEEELKKIDENNSVRTSYLRLMAVKKSIKMNVIRQGR